MQMKYTRKTIKTMTTVRLSFYPPSAKKKTLKNNQVLNFDASIVGGTIQVDQNSIQSKVNNNN